MTLEIHVFVLQSTKWQTNNYILQQTHHKTNTNPNQFNLNIYSHDANDHRRWFLAQPMAKNQVEDYKFDLLLARFKNKTILSHCYKLMNLILNNFDQKYFNSEVCCRILFWIKGNTSKSLKRIWKKNLSFLFFFKSRAKQWKNENGVQV